MTKELPDSNIFTSDRSGPSKDRASLALEMRTLCNTALAEGHVVPRCAMPISQKRRTRNVAGGYRHAHYRNIDLAILEVSEPGSATGLELERGTVARTQRGMTQGSLARLVRTSGSLTSLT